MIEYCQKLQSIFEFFHENKITHLEKKSCLVFKAKHLPSVFSLTFFRVLFTKLETNFKSVN